MENNSTSLQDLQLPYSLDVDSATGRAIGQVEIPVSESRSGFQPKLSLSYNSGGKESIFGKGWALGGISFISVNISNGLPKYDGNEDFAFNGSMNLVRYLIKQGNDWKHRIDENSEFFIYYYRAQNESNFARFEKWIKKSDNAVHWRIRSKDNNVSIYGRKTDDSTKILDPKNKNKVFKWLLESQYDALGNAIFYNYKSEDSLGLDDTLAYEKRRIAKFRQEGFSNKYVERIQYGNTKFLSVDAAVPNSNKWCFELVFDYGEYDPVVFDSNQSPVGREWSVRLNPYSNYSAGFEIRTYRLCQRILQFHNFSELSSSPSVTGIFNCSYEEGSISTGLRSVHYVGVRKDLVTGNYSTKELPPLEFDYTQGQLADSFAATIIDTNENVPAGFNDIGTRIVDLLGDGLPGILKETPNAWYYKRNMGGGAFAQQEVVINKPAANLRNFALGDFNRDGNINLYTFQGRTAGHYDYDKETHQWSGFTPFKSIPQVANSQFIDLNADGHPDLVVDREDRIIFYQFNGQDGFDDPVEIYKSPSDTLSHSPIVGTNLNLDYFLADMTGDGLPDQVRVLNGRVEYFPNLGNGKFGELVLMANAPTIAFDRHFDASKIRLFDLNGTGTSDLLYLGNGEIRYWYNASGNSFVEGNTITNLPYIDNFSSAQIFDFLGNGTPCLVWSSALGYNSNHAIQFLELTSGIKPGLMTRVSNSLGNVHELEYGYSAEHFLESERTHRQWVSKAPMHYTVVNKKIIRDEITSSVLASEYKYRDANYDPFGMRFVCFGLVEQYDSERIDDPTILDHSEFVQASCLKTWHHSGLFGWDKKRRAQFYSGDPKHQVLSAQNFEQSDALEIDDFELAFRSLAARIVRKEVYALDENGLQNEHPLQISQYSYIMRKLQTGIKEDETAYFSFVGESVSSEYEQNPEDPRTQHHITIELNNFGEITKDLSIAYARRDVIGREEAQAKDYITAATHKYFSRETIDEFYTTILFEGQDFEINTLDHLADSLVSRLEAIAKFDNLVSNAIAFNESFADPSTSQARLTQWQRTFFWNDAATDVLALGQVGTNVLSHHEETACFNDSFISNTYGSRVSNALLTDDDEGNYEKKDNYWWQKSAINHFNDQSRFFTLDKVEATPGDFTEYKYDPYFLHVLEITDPSGAKNSASIDYNVLQAFKMLDANDNHKEILFDELGVTVAMFSQGTILDDGNTVQKYGSELLTSYTRRTDESFDNILNNPELYLQKANNFLFYDLENFKNSNEPLRAISVVRENLIHDGKGNVDNTDVFNISITYTDGLGRICQTKSLVDPGLAVRKDGAGNVVLDASGEVEMETVNDRWLVSGHLVYNNKQQTIREFEPFFSSSVKYESDQELVNFGESIQLFYDAFGRKLKALFPNQTFSETVYGVWEHLVFDENDTVERSLYKTFRESLSNSEPEKMALNKAMAHKDTPSKIILDPLARTVITIEENNDGTIKREQLELDINGNKIKHIDARDLTAFEYKYDLQGRIAHEKSMDAGERWSYFDDKDRLIHSWNSRDVHKKYFLDALGRTEQIQVDGALGLDTIVEKYVYGDDVSVNQAKDRNLMGMLVEHYDQAGVSRNIRSNPNGYVEESERDFILDLSIEPDWKDVSAVNLENTPHSTIVEYDALGRSIKQRLPDKLTREFEFHKGGNLSKILISSEDGQMLKKEIMEEASYNAKGMRGRIVLGNDVEVKYTYDQETFRLTKLKSRKIGSGARTYQDISYHYDPVGNLIHLNDIARSNNAPNPKVLTGINVSGHAEYTYDALYQLVEAYGRVHQALERRDYLDRSSSAGTPANWMKGTRHISLNNAAAIERYTRKYTYDLNGNKVEVKHTANTNNWTKKIWTSATSNRSIVEKDLNDNIVSNPELRFDANGNCIFQAHLRSIEWNYRDNISRIIVIDRSAQGKPNDEERYVYGSDGIRLKKITQRVIDVANDIIEIQEKTYFGECEIKTIKRGNSTLLKRRTSKISDGKNKLATIHFWETDVSNRETDNTNSYKTHYQLGNHLGSASLELDDNANVISYEEYFPFGGTSFLAGRSLREIDIKEYRYTGKERDDFTGLYYFGYRYYAHWLGGWMNPDPLGPEDGLNLYAYVHNNPINLIDPNGLQSTGGRQRRGRVYTTQQQAAIIRRYNQSLSPIQIAMFQAQGKTRLFFDPRTGAVSAVTPARAAELQAELIKAGYDMYVQSTGGSQSGGGNGSGGDTSAESGGGEGTGGTDGQGAGTSPNEDPPSEEEGDGNGSGGAGEQGNGPGAGEEGEGPGGGGSSDGPTTGNGDGTGTGDGAGTGNRTGDGNGDSDGENEGGTGTRPGGTGNGNGTRPGGNGTRPGGTGTRPGGNGTNPNAQGTTPGGTGTSPGGNGTDTGGSGGGGTGGGAGTESGGSSGAGNEQGSVNGDATGTSPAPDRNAESGSGTGNGQNQREAGGNGTRQEGEAGGEGQEGNEGSGGGEQQGDPRSNWMDDVTQVAGYFNLEFGNDDANGEAGGIPGGMDLLGWRPPMWVRRTLQGVYVALTVITTVIPVGKLVLGAKLAFRAAMVGAKALGRRAIAAAIRILPTRAALRAVVTRGRGLISGLVARGVPRLATRLATGGASGGPSLAVRALRRIMFGANPANSIPWVAGKLKSGVMGSTSLSGRITMSNSLTPGTPQFLETLMHEGAHRFLSARGAGTIARFRQVLTGIGYSKSHFLKFMEEGFAQSIGSGTFRSGFRWISSSGSMKAYGLSATRITAEASIIGGTIIGGGVALGNWLFGSDDE